MTNRSVRAIKRAFSFARVQKKMPPYEKRYFRSLKKAYAKLPHNQRVQWIVSTAAAHKSFVNNLKDTAGVNQSK